MRIRPIAAAAALFLALGTLGLAPLTAQAAEGTFEDAPASTPIVVDNDSITRTIDVDLAGEITDINVTLDFHKVGDWCSNPSDFLAWNNEIRFDLTSPDGTTVRLIRSGWLTDDPENFDPNITYPSIWQSDRSLVVLDDQASVQVGNPERTEPDDRYPESGTFHTANRVLDGLNGEQAAGTWELEVTNESFGDELCYYGAALDITTADPIAAPALVGQALVGGVVGDSYSDQLPETTAGPIDTYAVVDPADLPPGLVLDADAGEITGIPTAVGDFAFDVIATGPGGSSAPARFTIAVVAAPIAALTISPGQATVDQGESIDFVVEATDTQGQPIDIAGQYELSSSVESDLIDGDRVTFPTASPHVITATHTASGLQAVATIEVNAAVQVVPAKPSGSDPQKLEATGWISDPAALGAIGGLLALMLVATGGLMLLRARRSI